MIAPPTPHDKLPTRVWEDWRELAGRFVAGGRRSIVLAGLDGFTGISLGGEVSRPGASLLKLPLVASVYAAAAEGCFSLTDRIAVARLRPSKWCCVSDALSRDGELTIDDLCSLAITVSDNPSADFLCELVGVDRVNGWLAAAGCSGASVLRAGFSDDDIERRGHENRVTANDWATVIRTIFASELCVRLRLAMYNNIRNQRIPRHLDDEIAVAHKTGSLSGVVNDAGFVQSERGGFIAVFLCEDETDPTVAEEAIARTSEACLAALKQAASA